MKGMDQHVYRRIQKLAWPFSRDKIQELLPPFWWSRAIHPSECFGDERETLPVEAVYYALHNGTEREDLPSLMPSVPPEAVLLAYGHVVVRQYMHGASMRGDYFGGRKPNHELMDDLHWTLRELNKLGYSSKGLSVVDAARFFANVNSIHCHWLPTGLLRLWNLAGHYGWPEAVQRELALRERPAYHLWAALRIRAYALARPLAHA
jgi:hypothetical protein